VPLIRGLFFAPGAEAILKIPLRQGGGEDWLAWLKENSGSYSVGSAYRALILTGQRQLQAQDEISELSAAQSGDLWKKLWKLGWYLKCMYFGGGFLWNPSRLRDPVTAACHGKHHLWDLENKVGNTNACTYWLQSCKCVLGGSQDTTPGETAKITPGYLGSGYPA
jgi:hypothetical protein